MDKSASFADKIADAEVAPSRAQACAHKVEVIDAVDISDDVRSAWHNLRRQNNDLWSPYFDIRLFDVLARHAPHAKLAVVQQGGEIVALLPFQGKTGSLARPLGAPMSDQHDLIQSGAGCLTLDDIVPQLPMSGFVFSGMRHKVEGGQRLMSTLCHVTDLTDGVDSYIAWRKENWNEQVKKNERRKRQGERAWGPMRIEVMCPKTSTAFDTLMTWKQAKYSDTNRHNVLGVSWINKVLRDLYESPDPEFRGEVTALYFGEHLAALEFGLRAGNAMHSWFPAYDHAFAKVSPGILLMDGMIEQCGHRGITKVDLGIGHDQYKRHASNAPVTMWSGSLLNKGLRRTVMSGFIGFQSWAQTTFPNTLGETVGRLERRSEMILAAEPTFGGRLKGYFEALKAINFKT
jgi:CelD/BcsL family acetyltransferase involved in cellulose biosynthesis